MTGQFFVSSSMEQWEREILSLPNPHLLQSWRWGQAKRETGWLPERLLWQDDAGATVAAAQILRRQAGPSALNLHVLYCPKGPLLDWSNHQLRRRVLADLAGLASKRGAVQLKIDADVPLGHGVPGKKNNEPVAWGQAVQQDLLQSGWRPSPEQIQYKNTMILDLAQPEEEILAGMKSKTRYNIRLAGRRGVEIRQGGLADLALLYQMFAETSVRDGFVIRSQSYYQSVWGLFIEAGLAQPLIAEVGAEPVAGLILYRYGQHSWYLYGMSVDKHRDKMPNYLLQWEAIRWSKAHGCTTYDLWGAPDDFNQEDSMWGVYRFKRGFNAEVLRTLGAWDYTSKPISYQLYHRAVPAALSLRRMIGRRQTASSLDD